MTEFRENLLTRMIHIYGFEHEVTIKYANMLERVPQTKENDKNLEYIAKVLEAEPFFDKLFCSLVEQYTKWERNL